MEVQRAQRQLGGWKMEGAGNTTCNIVISTEPSPHSKPIIFDPDFFVEKLRFEKPDVFLELIVSNLTRLIDLPGTEFAQLIGDEEPKLPSNTSFFRSFNFLRRKERGVIFGAPLTEEGIAQIYQLIEYLYKNLHVEGLFRVPGNMIRQQSLREALNGGMDLDLDSGEFHPNDAATLLKMFLGELPEPLLSHRHYNAHLKIAGLMVFDSRVKKAVPDKERQIEALQLLFLLLPSVSRNLLKLLLDLLYHTAKQQDKNKMSALNLALMFTPHILWPRNMVAADLQENITKLNHGVAFLIKHSQKLFRAPAYIRELARMQFTGSKIAVSKFNKSSVVGTPEGFVSPRTKKHVRSRSFGGLIKRKVLGGHYITERKSRILTPDAETQSCEHPSKQGKRLDQELHRGNRMVVTQELAI
ncbi:rho GTPase-activating protein 19 isoform X2 [Narcine bancroftii]|uniref:rho GTPase-activating protein 19 isoform X2 n=1 Tax=Narcine bancroftii TaxID=1343680 RepID=UPI0038315D7A